jgi:hypothetical protein
MLSMSAIPSEVPRSLAVVLRADAAPALSGGTEPTIGTTVWS